MHTKPNSLEQCIVVFKYHREDGYGITPAALSMERADTIVFCNTTDYDVEIKFDPKSPFKKGELPSIKAGCKSKPQMVQEKSSGYPYNAIVKDPNGDVDAEGSKPIIIIYD